MMVRVIVLVAAGGLMLAARGFSPGEDGGLDGSGPGLTLALGFLLLAAHLTGRIAAGFGLPKLTGYILAGIVVGPSALDLVTESMVRGLELVSGAATALIALTAGGELAFSRMRPLLRTIALVTLSAVLGTAALLVGAAHALGPLLAFLPEDPGGRLMVTGVIAVALVAQSPAVVIAVRSELGADGPTTRTVLGVVVAADFVVIVLFALLSASTRSVLGGGGGIEEAAGSAAYEIFGSIAFGIGVGLLIVFYLARVQGRASLFILLVCVGLAEVTLRLHLDPLIAALAAGVLVENASAHGHRLIDDIESASLPLYVLFFAVAGAGIHLDQLAQVAIPALVLVGVRGGGFLLGARWGTAVAGAPPAVRRYAGFGLLPQAGLALALALILKRSFPSFGEDASALIVGVVTINEIVSPILFRRALLASGEAASPPPPPASDETPALAGPPLETSG